MNPLPTKIDDLDGAWLTGVLRESGRIGPRETVTVLGADDLAAGVAFSTHMYRLRLAGPDGFPATAIVKLPVQGPVRELLDSIGAYGRECTFYRDFAADTPIRVPEPLVIETASAGSDFVLVLEDLADLTPLDQLTGLTLAQTQTAMDALARFHGWSWNHPRLRRYESSCPSLDSTTGRTVLARYAEYFAAAWPSACELADLSDEVRAFGTRLPALLPVFATRLTTPGCLTHGELRAENMFLGADGDLVFVDFQTIQQANGLVDVAYLLSQSLPTGTRRGHDETLVRRYWDGLVAAGVDDYPWQQAWRDYRLAVAYNLVLPGIAFTSYPHAGERHRTLLLAMLSRASEAIADNDSLELV